MKNLFKKSLMAILCSAALLGATESNGMWGKFKLKATNFYINASTALANDFHENFLPLVKDYQHYIKNAKMYQSLTKHYQDEANECQDRANECQDRANEFQNDANKNLLAWALRCDSKKYAIDSNPNDILNS